MNYPPIAGVRFRNAGKILYFHTAGMRLEILKDGADILLVAKPET